MARHTLAVGELHHPSDLLEPTEPQPGSVFPKANDEVVPFAPVMFVKNLHTREKLTFSNGQTFTFPGALYVCSDPEKVKLIREIATKAHIVERETPYGH